MSDVSVGVTGDNQEEGGAQAHFVHHNSETSGGIPSVPPAVVTVSRLSAAIDNTTRLEGVGWEVDQNSFVIKDRSLSERAGDEWIPVPMGVLERAVNLCPYLGQGAGLFLKWRDGSSTAAGPIYGSGVALSGVSGLKAAAEELYVLCQKGGRPNYLRLAAGVAEAAFAGSYGWYNAMGQNPAAGGFSAVLHGAVSFYRGGQNPGRRESPARTPILPVHNEPSRPNHR